MKDTRGQGERGFHANRAASAGPRGAGWARPAHWAVRGLAALFLVQLLLGWFGLPRGLVRWLSAHELEPLGAPRTLVVLGGGGIPSESGLMRTWYAAKLAREWPDTTVIVALPADGDPADSSVGRMRDELVLRGVDADRIRLEYEGRNTYEQALGVRAMVSDAAAEDSLAIVSSPLHLRRAVLCFRKAGFSRIQTLPAWNTGVEADLGGGTSLRYGFWQNLAAQPAVCRELAALAYYALRGRL